LEAIGHLPMILGEASWGREGMSSTGGRQPGLQYLSYERGGRQQTCRGWGGEYTRGRGSTVEKNEHSFGPGKKAEPSKIGGLRSISKGVDLRAREGILGILRNKT